MREHTSNPSRPMLRARSLAAVGLILAVMGVWVAAQALKPAPHAPQEAIGYVTPVPEPEPVPAKEPG